MTRRNEIDSDDSGREVNQRWWWATAWSPDQVVLATMYAALRWVSQPPFSQGVLVFVALVPALFLLGRRTAYRSAWVAAFTFWLVSLQGLRHANPLLIPCWVVLSAYLACYTPLFFWLTTRLAAWTIRGVSVPLIVAAPVAWMGCEWIRNHLLTGISACMLGHNLADYPLLVQIADLSGTYVVSGLVVVINVAVYQAVRMLMRLESIATAVGSLVVASLLLVATIVYGKHRLDQPVSPGAIRYALVGLDQQTEYQQDQQREIEIFRAYAQASLSAITNSDQPIDCVVWPESMYAGGMPYATVTGTPAPPPDSGLSQGEFVAWLNQYEQAFEQRARDVQAMLRAGVPDPNWSVPHLLVGCGVVDYSQVPKMHSGLLHIRPQTGHRSVEVEWYAKNHLVMFGEYAPIIGSIPGLQDLIPTLTPGDGATVFRINEQPVAANICIETAVERVAIGHVSELLQADPPVSPTTIVTVTNDAWFDHSSVVEHHLRCAQLVAVATRRSIVSAGNGGPTAWIDSFGRVRDRIPSGQAGVLIAAPDIDQRVPLSVRLECLPANVIGWFCSLFCVIVIFKRFVTWRRRRGDPSSFPAS